MSFAAKENIVSDKANAFLTGFGISTVIGIAVALMYSGFIVRSILLAAIIISLVPATIAKNKGQDFVAWWIFGFYMFAVAMPASIVMEKDWHRIERKQLLNGMKKCPFCAEVIKKEAKVCRYCSRELMRLNWS